MGGCQLNGPLWLPNWDAHSAFHCITNILRLIHFQNWTWLELLLLKLPKLCKPYFKAYVHGNLSFWNYESRSKPFNAPRAKDKKLWQLEETYANARKAPKMTCNCNTCHGRRAWTRKVVCHHLNTWGCNLLCIMPNLPL